MAYEKPDCAFCTGSHYLNDDEELGDCVCASAENMTAAEWEIDRLAERLQDANEKWDAISEQLRDARAHLAAYLGRLGLSIDAVRLPDPDLEDLRWLLDD